MTIDGDSMLIYNCSLSFADSPTVSQPVPSLDIYDKVSHDHVPLQRNGSRLRRTTGEPETLPQVRMIGRSIHSYIRQSPALGNTYNTRYSVETMRDFYPPDGFRNSVDHGNQTASELWLSAYLGKYIGNCLSLVNDLLERVQIEPESNGIKSKLLVKWERVAGTLGGLVIFQVLFGLAALWYCRRGFEIVDGVATYSSMFAGFRIGSVEEVRQGAVYRGQFVREGGRFRWDPVARAGQDTNSGGTREGPEVA